MRCVFCIPGLETAFSLIARENVAEAGKGWEREGRVGEGGDKGRERMFEPNKNHNFESIIRT